jgi:diguanylate cyclase (GGDEF)-like protein
MEAMEAARSFIRSMLERRADPYEGADLDASRRVTAALLGLSSLLSLAFLALDPVGDQVGWAGWPLAAVLILAGLGGAALLAIRSPSVDDLLVVAYLGVAGIATMNWLAGGNSSAYEDLFVLWVGAGAVHPPRRAFTHLAVMLAALALPLAYERGADLADLVNEALLLMVLGLLLTSYLHHIRRQRVGLRSGVEVARRLARVDALTGLGNRRAFDEALTIKIADAAREGAPLSVGLVDIDNLKSVNDRFGHLEGDRCLGEVARAMERGVRKTDHCFRWGGDEFVVMLPDSDREAAADVLGRMADTVGSACRAADGRELELTWGVAQIQPGTSPEDALAGADVALLEKKTEKRR